MRNLLNFLVRYNNLIIFLLLEGIAIILLAGGNKYHNTIITKGILGVTTGFEERVSNVRSYFSLRETNLKLANENALLLEQLNSVRYKPDDLFIIVSDTLSGERYSYTSATITGNSTNRQKNFFTINKGSRHGIKTDMAVVSEEGIAGIIVGCSESFSVAMSVINTDFRLSAMIKSNGYFGSLSWDGNDWRVANLADIPQHVTFGIGDTIVTTGFSALFTPDVPVGTISSFEKSGGDFFKIHVKLATDFRRLRFVKVIGDRQKIEQIDLETQFND
jgi:rod shape-determining protein MreC